MTASVGKHSLPQFEGAKISLIWLKSKDSEFYFLKTIQLISVFFKESISSGFSKDEVQI
jgi:hypothetical protein